MGLFEHAVTAVARRRWAGFERASRDPVGSQMEVFRGLMRTAAATEWGVRHGFADIRDPETYRNRVPLCRYEDMAPLWHRAYAGDTNVTWPGHIKYFAMSSGTTAGNKYLPVSPEAIRSNKRSGMDLAAVLVRRCGARAVTRGRFFYLGGSTTLKPEGRSFSGDASGIMALHMPFYARGRHLPEPDIRALSNWEEKIARIVERYLTADATVLSACPSWAALLFKEMRREALRRNLGERSVGELWARLACFVSYGMSFLPYRRAYEEYVGRPIEYVDSYSSSEGGMTAVQDEPEGPMRLIVDNGVFFEFVPADRACDTQPPRLHIGEVRENEDYAVVLNTNGGIWAYPLGDVIRFVSLRPPRIAFAGRSQIQLSAYGEHVTLEMIEAAMARACDESGALVADYTVCPTYPSPQNPTPVHRWLVEFDRPPADGKRFMERIDLAIRKESEDYDTHRQGDYGLRPPELVPVAPGTFYEWMKRQGKLGGQHKVPRVTASEEKAAQILAISAQAG